MSRFRLAGATHAGRVRERNEDSWACDDRLRLMVVADGMGGHTAGDVASRLAVESLLHSLEEGDEGDDRPGENGGNGGEDRARERMAEAVRQAHERILRDGEAHPERTGMGTTLTALQVLPQGDRYVVGHVGDSRGYLLRDGVLEPITRDHTPLQEKVDVGILTREEARVHPLGHVLSQALGTSAEINPQIVSGAVRAGDRFLLCSDGLTAVLSDDRIRSLLTGDREGSSTPRSAEDLKKIADRMVSAVLSEGAPDNVTVTLMEVAGG